ncbi:GDSL-type esterase/lipase family protein [Iamia sp.]|uniref:GDSL-type esterase/lipase family protein n=1 Tax=Iamia sp. TaxID=2722710 RepID=UPI002CEBF740|nr:GDSL-type esterase/lipase family protein [Iamia sp.]HXH55781.1 GDSL-type esterase/lipase family protein [Iamia sp.]
MSTAVVVDTMVAGAWLSVRPSDRKARWAPLLEPARWVLPFAVVAEMRFGAEVAGWGPRRRAALGRLVAQAGRAEEVLGHGGSNPPPPPPPTTDGAYVALGDSYASGEGNAPYHPGTDTPDAEPSNTCHRSDDAYANVAATDSAVVPDDVELAACSGAVIPDFYQSGEGNRDEAPQLDALGGTEPELVSVAIGGNDIGFVPILTACLQVTSGTSQLNPDYSEEACDEQLDEIAPRKIAELTTGLRDGDDQPLTCGDGPCTVPALFDDIAAGAPDALVAVVGYPPPLPEVTNGDCSGPLLFDDGSDAFG